LSATQRSVLPRELPSEKSAGLVHMSTSGARMRPGGPSISPCQAGQLPSWAPLAKMEAKARGGGCVRRHSPSVSGTSASAVNAASGSSVVARTKWCARRVRRRADSFTNNPGPSTCVFGFPVSLDPPLVLVSLLATFPKR
jgi:hypothetical protein